MSKERLEYIKEHFAYCMDEGLLFAEQEEKLLEELYKRAERVQELEEECKKLQAFYNYWSDLYGQGLEVANWHLNGELEPLDDFFDSAEEVGESK